MRWKRNTGFDQIEGTAAARAGRRSGVRRRGARPSPSRSPAGRQAAAWGRSSSRSSCSCSSAACWAGSGSILGMGGLSDGGAAEPGGTLDPQSDTGIVVSWRIVEASRRSLGVHVPEVRRDYRDQARVSSRTPRSPPAVRPQRHRPVLLPGRPEGLSRTPGFFDELKSWFGAEGGGHEGAYVVAHEFGHHVQTALGISEQVQQMAAQDPSRRNDLTIREGSRPTSLAGVWAKSSGDIQEGEIQEAPSAASAVGDDRIQVDHRPDRPGELDARSAEQRGRGSPGLQSGDPDRCDTFAA